MGLPVETYDKRIKQILKKIANNNFSIAVNVDKEYLETDTIQRQKHMM